MRCPRKAAWMARIGWIWHDLAHCVHDVNVISQQRENECTFSLPLSTLFIHSFSPSRLVPLLHWKSLVCKFRFNNNQRVNFILFSALISRKAKISFWTNCILFPLFFLFLYSRSPCFGSLRGVYSYNKLIIAVIKEVLERTKRLNNKSMETLAVGQTNELKVEFVCERRTQTHCTAHGNSRQHQKQWQRERPDRSPPIVSPSVLSSFFS